MAGELAGKVAIVTGGARGLGGATVELFAEEGAKVVIADVLDDEGQALADKLGDAVRYKHTDVSQEAELQALVDFAVTEFGGLHVMFNNAGLSDNLFAPLLEADLSCFDKIMSVNVMGVMLGTQVAGRHMAKSGGGSIINTSSISGIQPGHGFFTYRASKAAVVNFTQTAAIELGPHLIRVNCICPGNIPSDMGTFAKPSGPGSDKAARIAQAVKDVRMGFQPLKRQGSGRDIAEGALYFACDRSAQVTGQIMSIDGGATAGAIKSQIDAILEAREAIENEPD
ncbi:MAG: SDR family oxidoreductase [Novosphingobium sp.]|nr:SDR family oxidoreductase [Novosphingobium sp.]MCP5404139.1 SDR family oxidoreductase [Novosphingobium sp.]